MCMISSVSTIIQDSKGIMKKTKCVRLQTAEKYRIKPQKGY